MLSNHDFHFRGQKKDEKVLYLIEKHWIVHVGVMLYTLLLILASVFVYYQQFVHQNLFTYILAFIVWPLVLIFLLMVALVIFLNDRLDLLIVTNKRIMDVTQVRFLHREVSDANLDQIQDIRGSVKGIISAVFGVGTVYIQTAAQLNNFQIEFVSDPVGQARKILDVSHHFRHRLRTNGSRGAFVETPSPENS